MTVDDWDRHKLLILNELEDIKNDLKEGIIRLHEKCEHMENNLCKRYDTSIEKVNNKIEQNEKKLDKVKEEVTVLKTKGSVYGGLAGFLVSIIAQFITKFIQ